MVEEQIGVASGQLRWTHDGDDLVAGRYRLRLQGPGKWETTFRGRPLPVYPRCSMALAHAEHHHRETQRTRQITRLTTVAGVALLAMVVLGNYLFEPLCFVLFSAAGWVFLSSVARAIASATRNLLDPYRTREKWEPSDWWNHNP